MANRTIQIVIKADNKASKNIEEVEKSVGSFNSKLSSMLGITAKVTAGLGAALIGLAGISIKTASDYESAFAGVVKTTDGLVDDIGKLNTAGKELRQQFVDLTTEIPLTFEELAKIGELGGQLGIPKEALEDFTKTIAALGVSTNLSTENAASALARMSNIFAVEPDAMGENISRLGATIVSLGNNFATTEAEISEFAQRMAGAGKIAGLSQADVIGIGAALSSVGVQADAGGTAVQKVLLNMNNAVNTSADGLSIFAETAGMTAEQFQSAWKEDAGATFQAFVEGLGKQGDQAIVTLTDLELTDQRLVRSFLSLAGAGDLLGNTMDNANTAFAENTALMREADLRYATTESKFILFKNALRNTADAIGTALLPLVNDLLDAGTSLINDMAGPLANIIETNVVPSLQKFGEVISNIVTKLKEGDIKGLVTELGQDIVNGIVQGIKDFQVNFGPALTNAIQAGIDTFKSFLGISSPSTVFKGFGVDIIQGLINGIQSINISGIMGGIANKLSEQWNTNIYPELTKWGNQFWDWITIIAIPQVSQKITEIITKIGTEFTNQWPTIQASLLNWATSFWNWTSTIISEHPEYLGGLTGIIAKYLYDNWDTIAPELTRWGNLFWNFITESIIPTASEKLLPIINTIKNTLLEKWDTVIKPTLDSWADKVFEWVAIAYANIPTFLTDLTQGAADFFTNQWPTIQAALAEWGNKFWDWADTAIATIGTGLQGLAVALAAWATSEEAQQALHDLGKSIGDTLVTTLTGQFENTDNATSILGTLARTLLTVVTTVGATLIIVGAEIVTGIVDGILEHLGIDLKPATFNELGTILTAIGQDIKTVASVVGKDIINGIIKGITEIKDNISTEFDEIIESAKDKFLNAEWKDIGNEIVAGLIKGIRQKMGDWTKSITDLASSGIDAAKSFFGVQSPSTVFSEIGGNIMAGLSQGIAANRPAFIDTLTEALNIREVLRNAGIKGGGTYIHDKVIRKKFLPMLTQMAEKGTLSLESMKEAAHNLAREMNYPPSFLDSFINWNQWLNVINNEYDELQEKLRIENLTATLGIANQFAGFGQNAATFLDSQVETLTKLLELGDDEISFQGQILSAAEAQELLNQKLEEQAAIQKDLIELQSQQAQLQFMQQQLDIIKMVQEQGLNAADIFQGIQFGLEANVGDLLAVTSNIVQALIEQINSDLQIASPSQVMYDVGQRVMQGLAGGIMNNISSVDNAMKSIAPTLRGQAANTTSSVVNNYFNQTVNTSARTSTVVQDFQTMAALIG